jgi:hypothetical protein
MLSKFLFNNRGFATIAHGGTLPDEAQKTDFYAIIDNASISGITNDDISTITAAGKVNGSALTGLANIPSSAGVIPLVNLASSVPSGVICMWSGTVATIPDGWLLCDGTNGTPDLRDKFVIGAKEDSGGAAKTNVTGSLTQTGGAATSSALIAHTHGINARYGATSNGGYVSSNSIGASTETLATASAGSGTDFSIMNPYYALAFILKS